MKGKLIVISKPTGRRVELHLDGQPVSWADLLYPQAALGRAWLTFGGIANVGTHPEHRMKGYSRRVLERCIEVMSEDGLNISLLFGIPGYYDKFGYRAALSDYTFTIAGRDLIKMKQSLKARRLLPAEHVKTFALYRRDLLRRALGTERNSRHWHRIESGAGQAIAAEVTGFFRGERLEGYVVCDGVPDAVRVGELVTPSSEVLASALAWLGRQCRRKMTETVNFYLPPDHCAAVIAVELGVIFTRRTFNNRSGMMRILNLDTTFAALEAELLRRWQASVPGYLALDLTLQTDIGRTRLMLSGSTRQSPPLQGRIHIPQDRLIQLITGHIAASAMSTKPHVRIPKTMIGPLASLFPEQHPHILRTNHF